MKLSFACFSAMLGPVVALENEAHEQPLAAATPLFDIDLKSSKKNIYSFSSPFSKVKETSTYKKLLYRADVLHDPSKIHNSKSVPDSDADSDADDNADDGNMMVSADTTFATTGGGNNAGTDVDGKEYTFGSFDHVHLYIGDANAEAEAEPDLKGNTLKTVDTAMVITGVVIDDATSGDHEEYTFGSFDWVYSYDDHTTDSEKEVCVPPVTITKTGELDAGNLPLSSCSLQEQICINTKNEEESSSSSSSNKNTGVCLHPWDIAPTYSKIMDPNNGIIQSPHWEEPYSIGIAAAPFIHTEDYALYKEHHVDEAESYAHEFSSSGEPKNGDVPMTYLEDLSSTGNVITTLTQKDDYFLRDYDQVESERHLQVLCNECEERPPVYADGYLFRQVILVCLGDIYSDEGCPYPGTINCWDVSGVTNMDRAFSNNNFNLALGCWDTGSVKTMSSMFAGASNFNQPIDGWNVSQVTNMYDVFYLASSFNQPLDEWDVGQVTDMDYMFQDAQEFDQNIDTWNTGKVNYMSNMFQRAVSFNQPLDIWNVSQVYNMFKMFDGALRFNQCLSTWADKTPNDVNTFSMLNGTNCTSVYVNPTFGPWCQDEVYDECIVFSASPSASLAPSSSSRPSQEPSSSAFPSSAPTIYIYDRSRVCSGQYPAIQVSGPDFRDLVNTCIYQNEMSRMCPYDGSISCWDTSLVDDMKSAFFLRYSFNTPIAYWDVGQVTNMEYMFQFAYDFNQQIGDWDVGQVNNMNYMFLYTPSFNQPIENWNVGKVTEMFSMFYNKPDIGGDFNQPLDSWSVSQAFNMSYMFGNLLSFNQCLSTWADKTPRDVSTIDMLFGTNCTNTDAYATQGPWCQDELNDGCIAPSPAPTLAPSSSPAPNCKDDEVITFIIGKKKKEKGCEKIKAKQCKTKYKIKPSIVGEAKKQKPQKFCPKICNEACLIINKCKEKKNKKYELEGQSPDKKFKCKRIKTKRLCKTKLKGEDTLAKVVCPKSCKIKVCK